ncbi:MAG: ABC transporter ATP-binding protein [Granulosicoccus sp.]
MTQLAIKDLTMFYSGAMHPSPDQLSLEVASGELVALLGPSGCGKTTTMKMIAGLLKPTSGDVLFDGRSVLGVKPEERGAVMVFQNNLLFPYMSVAENVGFGLKMRNTEKSVINERVSEMLELVKLAGSGAQKPSDLSGGQQQRIALARALIVKPKLLLLDEPLSNLDANLRLEMRDLIRSLQQELSITTILVTHDQEEAVVMADKVALMLNGRLKQYAAPEVFYQQPADEATARFFGGINFIRGSVNRSSVNNSVFDCSFGSLELDRALETRSGMLTIRPESIGIAKNQSAVNTISTFVVSKTFLGTQTRLTVQANGQRLELVCNPKDVEKVESNQSLLIQLPSDALWFLER